MRWGRENWTQKEDARVLAMFRSGHDTVKIAKWYGVHEPAIVAMIDRARADERKRASEFERADPARALS